MNIFYAAGNQPHGALIQSRVWYYNLYLPLCDLGHSVTVFDFDLEPYYINADFTQSGKAEFVEQNRPKLEQELLRQIKEANKRKKIDVFFSYFYSSFATKELINEIRNMGILTINWYCNASYQFHLIEDLAPAYDYCLVPEKYRLEDYRRIGANPVYCQEAANPNVYKPYNLKQEYEVAFIGSQYGNRAQYISHLKSNNIDIRVWGVGWSFLFPPRSLSGKAEWWLRRGKNILLGRNERILPLLSDSICGDPLTDEEMVYVYSQSKISLGFSDVGETHLEEKTIQQVRLRDFEAPMSKAFYMTGYVEEILNFFVPDKEIILYYDKTDLLEKIRYYLKHDTDRNKIREAGFKRALNDHTWQKRLHGVFEQLGLSD